MLDAADFLFNDRGIQVTTVDDVADRAQVSAAEFTSAYASKNDLVEAVLDFRHNTWMGHIEESTETVDAPGDKILAVFGYLELWFAEDTFHGCVFINSYAELGRTVPWVAAMAARHVTRFTGFIEDLAVTANLPRSLGTSIALLAEGAQTTAALTHTVSPARDARSAAATLIAVYRSDLELPSF